MSMYLVHHDLDVNTILHHSDRMEEYQTLRQRGNVSIVLPGIILYFAITVLLIA